MGGLPTDGYNLLCSMRIEAEKIHLTGFVFLIFYGFLVIYSLNSVIENFGLCFNEELAAFD
jgi:hypothetical protein